MKVRTWAVPASLALLLSACVVPPRKTTAPVINITNAMTTTFKTRATSRLRATSVVASAAQVLSVSAVKMACL